MKNNYIIGIILILLGVGFLVQRFLPGFYFNNIIHTYWPLILIIIGLVKLSDKNSSKITGIIILLIGAYFQSYNLNLIHFSFWDIFWPIILLIIGFNLLIPKMRNSKKYQVGEENSKSTIESFCLFSGLHTLNQSSSFKGGNVTVLFGGADIDLRGANISEGEAYLELNAFFGGIDVFVPENWRVEVSGLPIFGGWSNKTPINSDPNAPILNITCLAAFGGIEIK
ncbi:hypothetical protein EQM13_14530 [Acidilutibacter cellobiosedens]|jgi:predicted membrane protein|uniref:DUF5668 domain-containing protein n=1 Tax=Acidilutibacter cellobiosedens TaxID=2507161 RepID=A0A410QFJ1_9FIRM|nr:DUF5668 domain-containing protein [Acidilutibacter cellobiosedens]QAT62696.1 hypothetical protein EQM13_14530 [Acidilutibacter cellobiosedens]